MSERETLPLPRLVRIQQRFDRPQVADIAGAVREQMARVLAADLSGKRIAVTAGSRGIRNIPTILRAVVSALRERGAQPFLVPAMGSHGGATAGGQVDVLESLGITEESVGAPICSSMEVVPIGQIADGGSSVPIVMDRFAWESDGVVVVNRIKTHTDFKGPWESGVLKMAVIGLGKHDQPLRLHRMGTRGLREVMPRVGQAILDSGKVLCGLGILENAYDETAHIEAIAPSDIPAREAELLLQSKGMMPSLPVEDIDVLIVDEIGKNYSGAGMDTNIIGRVKILGEPEPERPRIKYIFARDLSEATHGNAAGIGFADVTTRRLFDKIDFRVSNENTITSTFIARAAVPLLVENDRDALDALLRANWGTPSEQARIVHIPNTLELERVRVSEALLPEIEAAAHLLVTGPAEPITFDANGNLMRFFDAG